MKDIAYLQHEPLLEKFREIMAYQKKIKKALAKKDNDHAVRLQTRQPAPRYDGVILQRFAHSTSLLACIDTHNISILYNVNFS